MKNIIRFTGALIVCLLLISAAPAANVHAEAAGTDEAQQELAEANYLLYTEISTANEAEAKAQEEAAAQAAAAAEAAKAAEEAKAKAAKAVTVSSTTTKSSYKGAVLTRRAGTVNGPSGKEVYYNMNMSGVVKVLHRKGYSGDYWVRSDGVKMFGNYVMVAANSKVHPYGSIVQTSLGAAIVCDTGTFASSYPNCLDVATSW